MQVFCCWSIAAAFHLFRESVEESNSLIAGGIALKLASARLPAAPAMTGESGGINKVVANNLG